MMLVTELPLISWTEVNFVYFREVTLYKSRNHPLQTEQTGCL